MRSLSGPARRRPQLLAAVLGLSLVLPIVSLAAPAHAVPQTAVTVTVVDANGEAIDDAEVDVSTFAGPEVESGRTQEDGTVDFPLATGSYQVAASKDGFASADYRNDEGGIARIEVDTSADPSVTVDGEEAEDGSLPSMTLQSTPVAVIGQVLGAGNAGLPGITVQATPQDGPPILTQSTTGGGFTLPLPIETYTLTYLGAVVGNHTYVNTPGGELVVGQGAAPTLAAQAMTIDDGSTKFDLKGTISNWNGEPLTGVAVTVLTEGGSAAVASDTSRAIGGDLGAFQIGVRPGKYWLRFEKAGYQSTYLENGVDEGPVTVTVSPTGTVSAAEVELNADGSLPDVTLLLPPAAVVKAPKLTGAAVAGQTLTLSPGTWQGIEVDSDYVLVEWFIDGTPADDYSAGAWSQKFDVPVAAVGKKIGFKITVDDPEGAHASSVYAGSTGVVPKAAARIKGAFKKGKLLVTLTVAGLPKPTGSFLVKDGKKTLVTVKLKAKSKGKAVVKLTKLKPGKHKLTLVYAGSKTIKAAKATVKFKS
ncbi:hypothetical protein GCM10023350_33840 [Nocardioides endophyticus]|uniref:Bacterial Ig-like domain-containing protein n=1 Tax=Nocardioides endophyticus TaxID=1353775 RepID=A0ABP8Z4M7_9ACTN